MKSILIVGQSNMAGRGFLADVPQIVNENILMLRNGRWQMMAEPLNYDREVAGIGPSAAFAQAWSLAHPNEKIGIIPCAEGGSSIDEWQPEGVLTRHAISEAKYATEDSELIAILWHQGESDSLEQRYQHYPEKLTNLFTHFRQELALPELPIIVGELPSFLGKSGFGKSATEYQEINQALAKVVAEDDHSFFVTANGLTANPDGIHIDAASQRKFGLRYYQAFTEKADVLQPAPDEASLVAALTEQPLTNQEQLYLQSKAFALGKISYEEFVQQMSSLLNS